MRDIDVRKALHLLLEDLHRSEIGETQVIDELDVAGQVRIDTVVLNGAFTGFEIKSEQDTLRRLPRQVEVYSQVLDFANLVVARSHVTKARQLVPSWWGIIEAVAIPGGVRLRPTRKARRNPRIDPLILSTLLWREEVLLELDILGAARGVRSKPNSFLWKRLATEVPPDMLRDIVRERIKARAGWRAEKQSLLSA